MAASCGSVSCSVKIETAIVKSNNLIHKSCHRNSKLSLGRNEFREIILQVSASSFSTSYVMKNVNIHKRFMKDGKATITLKDDNVSIMLSNCPPNVLLLFLRTLATKIRVGEGMSTPLSIKQRLLSEKRKQIQEISPINVKDLNFLCNKSSESNDAVSQKVWCNILENTKKKSLKRTLDEDKENNCPSQQVILLSFFI